MKLAPATMFAIGLLSPLAFSVPEAAAQYRSYTFNGCAQDGKRVSQAFIWDMKVGKERIMAQSKAVKAAYPGVVKRYSSAQLKKGAHLNALLGGRVSKDGTVTLNPPKFGGAC